VLASHIGCATVEEAQSKVNSRQFKDWIAFYRISPFGDKRDDIRTALICSTVARCLGAKGRAAKPETYMLEFVKKYQTPEEFAKMMKQFKKAKNVKKVIPLKDRPNGS